MKQFIKYLSSLWLSAILSSVLAFVLQASLARMLTPSELGEFNSTLAYMFVFGALAGFGVDNAFLKIFGRGRGVGNKFGKNIVIYSVLTTFISFILLIFFSIYIFTEVNINNLLILSPILLSLVSFNLRSAILQVERRYYELSIWQVVNNGSKVFFILFAFFDVFDKTSVYYLYSASSLIIFLFSIPSFIKLCKGKVLGELSKSNNVNFSRMKSVSLMSIPFGCAGIAHTIYFQSDIFLISYLYSAELAGYYSVSFSIITAIYLFPAVIYQKVLLPRIHEWSNKDEKKVLLVFQSGNGIMLIIGFAVAVVVYFSSDFIIKVLFGSTYQLSADFLMLLVICIPVRFLISGLGAVLSTKNLINYKLLSMVIVAIFNAGLNFIFIPDYGVYAAISTTIASEFLLLILFFTTVYMKLFGKETFTNWFKFNRGIINV